MEYCTGGNKIIESFENPKFNGNFMSFSGNILLFFSDFILSGICILMWLKYVFIYIIRSKIKLESRSNNLTQYTQNKSVPTKFCLSGDSVCFVRNIIRVIMSYTPTLQVFLL